MTEATTHYSTISMSDTHGIAVVATKECQKRLDEVNITHPPGWARSHVRVEDCEFVVRLLRDTLTIPPIPSLVASVASSLVEYIEER